MKPSRVSQRQPGPPGEDDHEVAVQVGPFKYPLELLRHAAENARLAKASLALRILVLLVDYAASSGQCWPAIRTLAKLLSSSPDAVRNALELLVELGYVHMEPQTSPAGDPAPYLFSLPLDRRGPSPRIFQPKPEYDSVARGGGSETPGGGGSETPGGGGSETPGVGGLRRPELLKGTLKENSQTQTHPPEPGRVCVGEELRVQETGEPIGETAPPNSPPDPSGPSPAEVVRSTLDRLADRGVGPEWREVASRLMDDWAAGWVAELVLDEKLKGPPNTPGYYRKPLERWRDQGGPPSEIAKSTPFRPASRAQRAESELQYRN